MSKNWKGILLATLPFTLMLIASQAFAQAGGGGDITSIANSVKTQATSIATLMNVAAYVAGVGFALAGVLQFKAHKDNPQSTPLSKPIVMIVVAAALLFLPTVMNIAGQSIFGSSGQQSIQYQAP